MKRSPQNNRREVGLPTVVQQGRILFSCILVLALSLAVVTSTALRSPAHSGMVVCYHPEATQAGYEILQAGGNAFDAFIAAAMAEYVLSEGVTSLAGPFGALIYDAKTAATLYLDGEFNEVRDPKGRWTEGDRNAGKAVVVPGAVAALEALSSRYGRLPFSRVLQPAIKLARDGFPVSSFYAAAIAWRADILRRSDYGRRTFFRAEKPLQAGDLLKQPEVAEFLNKLSQHGAAYMYHGQWASRCIETLKAEGGLMSLDDLASYRPAWVEPLRDLLPGP